MRLFLATQDGDRTCIRDGDIIRFEGAVLMVFRPDPHGAPHPLLFMDADGNPVPPERALLIPEHEDAMVTLQMRETVIRAVCTLTGLSVSCNPEDDTPATTGDIYVVRLSSVPPAISDADLCAPVE